MMNKYPCDSKMSEKMRKSHHGTAGAAGVSTMSTRSNQKPKCFRDIMDLVLHLSDEEWKSVSRGMTKEVTRVEFVATCTKVVTSVSYAIVRRLLQPLSKSFGMKAIVEANEKLKKMELEKCSDSDAAAQKSPMEVSDFICHLTKRIVTEIKGAMLAAIRGLASAPKASPVEEEPFSRLDDLSIRCTNEICDKILALYLSADLNIPGEETMTLKSILKVHKIMKGLEEVVSSSRSSSWITVSTTPDSVSTTTEVTTPASSTPQSESPSSEQFLSTAIQMITEILLKTEQTLAASVSSQTSEFSETELNFLMELANSTATEILQKLYFLLHSFSKQSVLENEDFLSYAQMIHTHIHKQVYTFVYERKQAVSEKSKAILDACTQTDADLDVHKSVAVKKFLHKATQEASDILVKRLNSHISTSSGSSTAPSSRASVPLEIGLSDMEGRAGARVGEAPLAPDTERVIHTEEKSLPSVQNGQYVPLNLFSVARNQLKAFFTSFGSSAPEDKSIDLSEDSDSYEDFIPFYISGESAVQDLEVGRGLSDSVLERRNSMLNSMQFPSVLIYTFIEESVKALLQNVLHARPVDGRDGSVHSTDSDEGQEMKKRPRLRFVVKTDRRIVVKHPKKPKKRGRFALQKTNHLSTSANLHDGLHREPKSLRSVFKRARRTLGMFFSKTSPSPSFNLESAL